MSDPAWPSRFSELANIIPKIDGCHLLFPTASAWSNLWLPLGRTGEGGAQPEIALAGPSVFHGLPEHQNVRLVLVDLVVLPSGGILNSQLSPLLLCKDFILGELIVDLAGENHISVVVFSVAILAAVLELMREVRHLERGEMSGSSVPGKRERGQRETKGFCSKRCRLPDKRKIVLITNFICINLFFYRCFSFAFKAVQA